MDGLLDLASTRGRITVSIHARRVGDDLSVTIGGGDRAHIGAVALSQPRPSGTGASTSVVTVLGHREDELARRAASRLASALGVTSCVTCGIHVDGITRSEIRDVEEMVDELTAAVLDRLGSA